MSEWRPLSVFGLMSTLPAFLFFIAFPLVIAPRFSAMFRDFGGALPALTVIAMHPLSSVAVLLVLGSGIGAAVALPKGRSAILCALAVVSAVLVATAMASLYLPIFSLAGQVK